LLGIFLLDLVATPLALLGPVPLKIAVDTVVGSQPLPPLLRALLPDPETHSKLLLLGCGCRITGLRSLPHPFTGFGELRLADAHGRMAHPAFPALLFRHVQRLAFAFHDARGTADTIYRIQYDAPSIQWLTIHGVIPLLTSAITLLSMIYVTACLDWQLALVAMSIIPFLMAIPKIYDCRMRGQYTSVKELESSSLVLSTRS
jgi:ATP-binding cassette subfamily B protein